MKRTNRQSELRSFLKRVRPVHWLIGALLLAVGFTSVVLFTKKNETAQAETEPVAAATVLDAHIAWGQGLFQLTNRDSFAWTSCKLEVNATDFGDGYSVRVDSIAAHSDVRILAEEFKKADGSTFSFGAESPSRFTVRCLEANGKPGIYVGRAK